MRIRGRTVLVLCTAVGACNGGQETTSGESAPVFRLRSTVEIGVVEGDPHYMFEDISAAVVLSTGDLAVADRGSSEISVYDPSGLHKRTFGRTGDGPGEFQNVAGLYVIDGDSLLVPDGFNETVTVVDSHGVFARSLRYADLPGDTLFRLGTWIVDRYLVRAAYGSGERRRVDQILSRHVVPGEAPGFRSVIAEEGGAVWIHEPAVGNGNVWIGLDDDGSTTGWVDLPAEFSPLSFYGEAVLGRALDSLDVQSLRAYAIEPALDSRPVPSWLVQTDGDVAAPEGEGWSGTPLTEHIRSLAGSQEVYYSTHYSYAASTDSLAWEHEDVRVAFRHADARGWVGIFNTPAEPTVCGMAYGFPIPPGWRMGQLLCGGRSAPW